MTSRTAADGDDYTYERRSGVAVFNANLAAAEVNVAELIAQLQAEKKALEESTRYDLPAVETHAVPEKGWTVTTCPDLRTPDQRERDDVAALHMRIDNLVDAVEYLTRRVVALEAK